jgi:hypothetical protein
VESPGIEQSIDALACSQSIPNNKGRSVSVVWSVVWSVLSFVRRVYRSFRPSFPSFDGLLVPCLSWSAIDPWVPCPKPNQVIVFFFRG